MYGACTWPVRKNILRKKKTCTEKEKEGERKREGKRKKRRTGKRERDARVLWMYQCQWSVNRKGSEKRQNQIIRK